uniref:Uncharacterized protein n=1 Tax=Trypanosoma congolense (strain IL3000) TaxID=1068625 RepID=G0ULR6_TRYCI|nr:hypothetical protein, unlikely [Trypanosoma congolense IL3000]
MIASQPINYTCANLGLLRCGGYMSEDTKIKKPRCTSACKDAEEKTNISVVNWMFTHTLSGVNHEKSVWSPRIARKRRPTPKRRCSINVALLMPEKSSWQTPPPTRGGTNTPETNLHTNFVIPVMR